MKYLFLLISVVTNCLAGFSQTEVMVGARPVSMGYCSLVENKCSGELISIVEDDISGFMLQIYFKKEERLTLRLYRNGELIEDVYSINFKTVKVSKKNLHVNCNSFFRDKIFHQVTGANPLSTLSIDISLKKRVGKVSFFYPEESKVFIYHFNLL